LIQQERKVLPRLGGKKIHHLIKDQLAVLEIKMGRDKLFEVMRTIDN
jgi:hypothetical protein